MNDKENLYTKEYDSATKKEKKILIFVTTYMDLRTRAIIEISQREKDKYYMTLLARRI